MCQPLPPLGNGKRCLIHSKATVAELHFTWAKTGVDKENIYAILKQLNKEGRKLDAPELAEVKEFLDKEEFKVKLDPDLSDRDRKMILKNLAKARGEAEEQGVTGGAFHAWKNVFKETVAKMKKPLVAIGLTGVLAFSLAGCGGALNDSNDNTNSPAPTETVACSTANPGDYGDVIALKDVTDENGTYCQTTIDPTSDAFVYDASKVDVASLAEHGFTEEDAKKAQETTVKFVTEEALDSAALDSTDPAALSTWVQKNESKFSGDWDVAATEGVIYNGSLPVLTRDGNPRSAGTTITVTEIRAQASRETSRGGVLVVDTLSTVQYRMSDEAATNFYLKNGYTGTREAFLAENPALVDNVENILVINAKYAVGYNKEGKINGVSYTYTPAEVVINNN